MNLMKIASTKGSFLGELLLLVAAVFTWLAPVLSPDYYVRVDSFPERAVLIFRPVMVILTAFSLVVAVLNATLAPSPGAQGDVQPFFARFRYRMGWLAAVMFVALLLLLPLPGLSGNLVFLGAPLVAAWALTLLGAHPESERIGSARKIPDGVILMVLFTGLFWWSGNYYAKSVGEHAGDEGHYLIQARSLYEDGDLDVMNQFDRPEKVDKTRVHISQTARDGKWYSWHPPGISFLLAPTIPLGVGARHLVLGFISGLGLAGLYWLAREIGTSRRHAWISACLLGGGIFWGVYSSRALPEVLGATLAVHGLLLCLLQRRYPWAVILPFVICVSFLPWVQTRFLPVAVTLIGCFGLHGLIGPEPLSRKLIRLSVFTSLSVLGFSIYYVIQHHMFYGGMSYPVPKVLFSLPAGLWHSLASERGILLAFPVFACALAATVTGVFRSDSRWPAIYGLLVFLSVWLTSCGTIWFTGGACLPGRFLLVTTPILMAFLGWGLDKASSAFRGLVYFLSLVPVGLFVAQLARLPHFGKSFATPYTIEKVHPLFDEMARFFYDPYATLEIWPALGLYAAAGLLIWLPKLSRPVTGIVLVALAIMFASAARFIEGEASAPLFNPRMTAKALEEIKLNKSKILVWGDPREEANLLAYSDRFWNDTAHQIKSVTSRDLGGLVVTNWISSPHLPVNDWEGRDYRWATIAPPFPAGKGRRAVLLDAHIEGPGSASLAIREGGLTHIERTYPPDSRIREVFDLAVNGLGDLYVLVRVQDGDFINHRTSTSLFSSNLLKKAKLDLDYVNSESGGVK